MSVLLVGVFYDFIQAPDSEACFYHLINVAADTIEPRYAPILSIKFNACVKKSETPSRVTYWTIRLR